MWAGQKAITLLQHLDLDDDANSILPAFDLSEVSATNLKMTITTSALQQDPQATATFFRITRNTAVLAKTRRLGQFTAAGHLTL